VLHELAKVDATTREKQLEVNDVGRAIIKCWSMYLQKPAEPLINAVDRKGQTALHLCATIDAFELLRFLISQGPPPPLLPPVLTGHVSSLLPY